MGVKHVANGDGTVTQIDADTGQELVTFPDPDGSFTRDHLEPAAAAPSGSVTSRLAAGGASAGGAGQPSALDTNGMSTFRAALAVSPASRTGGQQPGAGAGTASVMPDVSTVTHEAPESEFERSLKPPASATETAARGAPTGEPGAGSRLPVVQEQTTGLAPEDRQRHREEVASLKQRLLELESRQETSERQALDAREQRVQAESDRALGAYAVDLENHERAKDSLQKAEQVAKDARAQPIDPSRALGGGKFFAAIMAGVGASLSNFGAALLGQHGTQDTNLVDDIIADSVKQQMADRQLGVEGAQDSLEAARKEELRLSIQANASLEKWFESKAAVERNPEVRAAWAAQAEERRAAVERDAFKWGEVEYNQQTQTRAMPKPVKGAGAGAGAPLNAETKEDLAALAENGINQKQLTEYGTERAKTGADSTLKHVADMRQLVKALTQPGSTDIPGVGPIDEHTQSLLRSNDASKVQQARGFLVSAFAKSRSGAAVTDKEREYLNNIVMGTGSNQVESLENGLRGLESEANTALATLDRANPGAARAYGQIQQNQSKRSRLSEENASNLAAQRKQRDQPPAAPREKPAPEAPAEATPDNVAEFLALPGNNPRGRVYRSKQRPSISREEDLRQLLESE